MIVTNRAAAERSAFPLANGRRSALALLLVEDNPGDADLARERLAEVPGYRFVLTHVTRLGEAIAALGLGGVDGVLLDLDLPDSRGLASLERLRAASGEVAVVVLSGHGSEELQRAVLRAGAQDFVGKDEGPRLLVRSILFALERHRADERHRRMEEKLRQAQKLEAVGRLAGGVAHDFNNLLCVILGYGEMLRSELAHDDRRRKPLDRIVTAAERARDLTRQLLAFGRRQVIRPTVVDLAAILRDTVDLLRRVIPEDVEIVVSTPPGPCRVEVDPAQIEQVIMNLALNARDAMPGGGRLSIETSVVELGDATAGVGEDAGASPHVVLAVGDTGCGMDKETLANVFEPFFTTKEVGKGTGLGLSTVYGIVEQSGGRLRVESEPGRGSRFEASFPEAAVPPPPAPRPTLAAPAEHGAETILLVEDDDSIRELSREILETAGYRVLAASGGVEAVAVAGRHDGPLHLLVTDVVMQDLGGRDLAGRLAAGRPELRVLFMSGYAAEANVARGSLPRDATLLEKPFIGETLRSKVREVLDAVAGSPA